MMIVAQMGQSEDKDQLIKESFRLRKKIFVDEKGWKLAVTEDGLERDQFDHPGTVYLFYVQDGIPIGIWRLLPSLGPHMIHEIWPKVLETLSMPKEDNVWEVSRFAIDRGVAVHSRRVASHMLQALTALCMKTGIDHIYTFYELEVGQFMRALGCHPEEESEIIWESGKECRAGAYKTDQNMLDCLQKRFQFDELFNAGDLPPLLHARL